MNRKDKTIMKTVLIINAYETSMHSGHYEVIPFTNKRKAVRKARKLSGSNFLGWGATGYLTVVKNHEVVASYPIHEEVERRRRA